MTLCVTMVQSFADLGYGVDVTRAHPDVLHGADLQGQGRIVGSYSSIFGAGGRKGRLEVGVSRHPNARFIEVCPNKT